MALTNYRFARRAEILGTSIYDHTPGAIVLSSGLAHPPLLPDVSREATMAARSASETMQYGPLMGLDSLREQIVRYVKHDGIDCERDNVLVTNGAKHAFDLACRVFVEPGDLVIVSRPTYMTALIILRTHGASFLAVEHDEDGMNATDLEKQLERLSANGERMPKLLFDVPDFHNPTGVTMSLDRRRRLIDLAKRYGFVICEDDPYRRIRFEGKPVSPLKALDDADVVIALGTVSKILSPGLRTGWAVGAPDIVRRMAMQKAEGGSGPFSQKIVMELMRSNRLAEHISLVRSNMRIHRDATMDGLVEFLPDATVTAPSGGYFLWAELPEGVSAEAVSARAALNGVEVSSGRLCFPDSDPGRFLRLAYSFPSPDEIREGIRLLSAAYHAVARSA